MSDLQLALIALGAALVAAVAGYNVLQERRARRRAEAAFRGAHPDALLDPVEARLEPVLGELPADDRQDPSLGALDEVIAPAGGGEAGEGAAPGSVISSRIDTVAMVLADQPVTRAQVGPLLDALEAHATPKIGRAHV